MGSTLPRKKAAAECLLQSIVVENYVMLFEGKVQINNMQGFYTLTFF